MTLVFTDLVGSTRLKQELGNREAVRLILEHHALVRALLREYVDGFEISTAGDSFFLAFRRPSDAVSFALRMQGRLQRWNRGLKAQLLDRIGIHAGEVTVETDGEGRIHDLHGLEVDKCARVMSLGREHHILVTRFAFENARASLKGETIPEVGVVDWVSHGFYELKGVSEPIEICEVAESGRTGLQAPEDSEKARRVMVEMEGEGEVTEVSPVGWKRWWLGRRKISTRKAVWGSVVVAMAGLAGLGMPGLVLGSYDRMFAFRPVITPSEAVLVHMDRTSHNELVKDVREQTWNRRHYAALIDQMKEAGARLVVLDVLFDKPSGGDPAEDAALVESAKRAGNVCVAGVFTDVERNGERYKANVGPFPALEAVVEWGVSWFPARVDEVIRRPSLGNAQKDALAVVVAKRLGRTPPARGSDLWLNYYGGASTFAWHPLSSVLLHREPTSSFRDKIVFVGAVYDVSGSEGKRQDDFPTPYTRQNGKRSMGVEVLATSALNLLRGESLRRTPWYVECAILIGVGLGSGFGMARLRGWVGLGVGVILAASVAWISVTRVWSTHVWFPFLVVCAAQVPVALVWCGATWLGWAGPRVRSPMTRRDGLAMRGVGVRGVPEPSAKSADAVGGGSGPAIRIPEYRLMRVIGRGAYGTVWLARDAIGLLRAVKVVERRSFSEARPYEREFEGIQQFVPISLEHPGMIRVLHVGRDDREGYFYYVMEAADDAGPASVRGEVAGEGAGYVARTLEGDLKERGAVSPGEVVELGLALGRALDYLHGHGLIHRDIKPANVLYVRGQPKLGDIGLVTAMAGGERGVTFLGTKGYMAPEGPGGASADVYSLGKLLFVAATGRPPDDFPMLPDDVEQRPDRGLLLQLNQVWLKACEPEAAKRMPTAAALVSALEGIRKAEGGAR